MTDHSPVSVLLQHRHCKGRNQTPLDVQNVDWFIILWKQLDVIVSLNGELQWVPEN